MLLAMFSSYRVWRTRKNIAANNFHDDYAKDHNNNAANDFQDNTNDFEDNTNDHVSHVKK